MTTLEALDYAIKQLERTRPVVPMGSTIDQLQAVDKRHDDAIAALMALRATIPAQTKP